jgi:hypothetical protein
MKILRLLMALTLLCLFQVPAAFSQARDKHMTDGELSKFVVDWPAAVKWFDERSRKLSSDPSGGIPTALLTDKDFKAFIAKRGWTDNRFAYVAGTVFSLLSIVTLERKNPDLAKQFDDAIAQIEASELSPAEKEENIKAINEARNGALAISSDKSYNQDELKLVRERYGEITKAAGITPEE